ncbi:MAG: DUF971 domain-containing protein [Caldilineaceae bacterium]|nr:DUF971 domain-containing protein [Caldilineaceae bacterium]
MSTISSRPQNITVDRQAGTMQITWQDGHASEYTLAWLRANCPCATCREERWQAAANSDPLKLTSAPPPSIEIAGAEFVGHYAIRFTWKDGHGAGIFPFTALRAACPCAECSPEGAPPLILD